MSEENKQQQQQQQKNHKNSVEYAQFNVIIIHLKCSLISFEINPFSYLLLPLDSSTPFPFSVFHHHYHSLPIISSDVSSNFTKNVLSQRRFLKISHPRIHTYSCVYDYSSSSTHMEGPFMILATATTLLLHQFSFSSAARTLQQKFSHILHLRLSPDCLITPASIYM